MLIRGVITVLLLSGVLYSMGNPPPNYDNRYDEEIEEAVSADIESIQSELREKKEAKLSSISIKTFSFQEKIITKKDGTKVRKNIPVKEVIRDSSVVYINKLINNDSEAQNNIVVKNPIPSGTEYVKGSATCAGGCTISYSSDGGETLSSSDNNRVSYIEFHFSNLYPNKEIRMGFRAIVK